MVAAVADGAGSAPRSDEGSQIAVNAAVTEIVDGINRQPAAAFVESHAEVLLRSAIMQAKIEVERYGLRHNVPARELACTLIVAFASDSLMAAVQVGDGAVVAFNIGSGAAMTLCGLGLGLFMPNIQLLLANGAPQALRGRLMGSYSASLYLGQFVSPLILQVTGTGTASAGDWLNIGFVTLLVGALLVALRTHIERLI